MWYSSIEESLQPSIVSKSPHAFIPCEINVLVMVMIFIIIALYD